MALTRARKQIFLLGHAKGEEEKAKPDKNTFLSYLWPATKDMAIRERAAALLVEGEKKYSEPKPALDAAQNSFSKITRLGLKSLPKIDNNLNSNVHRLTEKIEFQWAGPLSKHIGTITHRLLEVRQVRELSQTFKEGEPDFREFARRQLLQLGVPKKELSRAISIVLRAIKNTFSSNRGAWIFSSLHDDVEVELALSSVGSQGVERIIVDRTFVDSAGVRWIIDFKTGDHSGAGLVEYLDSEQRRYEPQLERYAKVMSEIFPQPIMLGLYFPLLSEWREWSPLLHK